MKADGRDHGEKQMEKRKGTRVDGAVVVLFES
jgi:hypothetical protein